MSARRSLTRGIGELLRLLDPGLSDLVRTPHDDRCLQSISASQYQIFAQVSKSTATRHLTDLLEKNCLENEPGGGRNTRYRLKLTHDRSDNSK